MVDRHIQIGRYRPFHITVRWGELGIHFSGVDYIYDADSVKFLPDYFKKVRYIEVSCKPGITVTFTPLTTTIYAQTHYATSKELMTMRKAVASIENYLLGRKKSFMNICNLKK